MDDEARILYVQTHGVDEPSKAATPFYLATAAAAMDMDVAIYFTMHGPTLVQKGTPETLTVKDGGAPLETFISQAQGIGVKFLVCQPSLDLVSLEMEDLIFQRDQFEFDAEGSLTRIVGLEAVNDDVVEKAVSSGIPFMTNGCPGPEGEPGCTRPYGSYRPSEPMRDYPFLPGPDDLITIRNEMRLSEVYPA